MSDVTPSSELAAAIEHGDVLRVRNLLDNGADPNARYAYGWTPLQFAAGTGHTPIIELLLARGANVKATNDFGCSPLAYAALEGRVEAIGVLLGAGASISVTPHGVSLLQFAKAGGGRFETQRHFEILREAGAS